MNIDKCLEYVKSDNDVIASCSRITYFPLVVHSVDGDIIKDVDGNEFIDFLSSASATNLGGNDKINEAIINQVNKFVHYTPAYSYNTPMIELAKKLTQITPGNYKKKVAFGLSGSDANDGAIKFARAYTGKSIIITFIGGYHGSTYGSMTMSAITPVMKRKIGPFISGVYSFPYPNCYRCSFSKEETSCNLECLNQLKEAFDTYIPIDDVAGVVIEPVQGDSGMVVPSKRYIKELYNLCMKNEILFISEEVQQGFGRTGKWFGIEHFDVIPDMVILGKSIASGMPLSAIVGRKEIMESLDAPMHTFTNAANPICCSAGISLIDIISEDNFLDNVSKKGDLIKERFRYLKQKYGIIGDIRGLGLSIGVEILKDISKKEKDIKGALKICYRCYEKGLLLITLNGNTLRIQPPLTITEQNILNGLNIIEEAIKDYTEGNISDETIQSVKGW